MVGGCWTRVGVEMGNDDELHDARNDGGALTMGGSETMVGVSLEKGCAQLLAARRK